MTIPFAIKPTLKHDLYGVKDRIARGACNICHGLVRQLRRANRSMDVCGDERIAGCACSLERQETSGHIVSPAAATKTRRHALLPFCDDGAPAPIYLPLRVSEFCGLGLGPVKFKHDRVIGFERDVGGIADVPNLRHVREVKQFSEGWYLRGEP